MTMRLQPRSAFTLVSPLGLLEARRRLSDAIASTGYDDRRPFIGQFDGRTFDVMRTSRGRNSFRPRIRGTIEPVAAGSRIQGTMQLHEAVTLFMGVLVLFPTWLFVQMLLNALRTQHWDPSMFALPAAVIGLMIVMRFAFSHESRRAEKELRVLLDGDSSSRS